MTRRTSIWSAAGATILFLLAACSGGGEQSGQAAAGPQKIENATQIIKFDPASISTASGPVVGICREWAAVPGTYQCDLADKMTGPCFVQGGTRLICAPDPMAGTYGALVSPSEALPSVAPPAPEHVVAFFVELDGGVTCTMRAAPEPVIIDGMEARYECSEPYTYILGEGDSAFSHDAPLWEAGVHTLDPATGQSSGKVPVGVRRAWIP